MSKVSFEIEEKEYVLPEFLSIENYSKIYMIKDFMGEEFFQAKLIHALTGVKMENLLRTSHTEVNYISNYIMTLFPNNNYPFIDKFTLNGIEYGFIPSWKHMSFAEFVDLDTLMNKKPEEIVQNLHYICAIMYRPIISKKKEHEFKIEDYDVIKMEERAELFKKELDVKYVLGGQFFFFTIRKTIIELFPAIFDTEDEELLGEDGNNVEVPQDNMEVTFEQAFGWFAVINRISQDDLTKHKQILQAPILEALNQLLYLVQKDKEIERLRRKAINGF